MAYIEWRGYTWLAWLGAVALAFGTIMAAARGNSTGATVLAIATGACVVFLLLMRAFWQRRVPHVFELVFVLAVLLNGCGYAFHLFGTPGAWDEVTHGFTIFAITLALGLLLYGPRATGIAHAQPLFWLMVTMLGVAIGAWWEVVEYYLDQIPSVNVINPLGDTISDLIMDTIGAGIAALICLAVVRQAHGHGHATAR